jgi:hypothetical protein
VICRLNVYSSDPELALSIDGELPVRRCFRLTVQVKFEAIRHHDDGLWSIAVLEAHEAKRRGAIDEEAPANPFLVLNYPIASAVLTDHEHRRP